MVKSNIFYMDYASSADPNPSSIHAQGVEVKTKLEKARGEVSSLLSARPSEVIFTRGGTESNNLAILGTVANFERPHIVTTNIEHASVMETFLYLEKTKQATVTFVPVEPNGIVDPRKIRKALKSNTVLVSVMYANNEIGTIQPIREIAKEIRHFKKINEKSPLVFHSDAVQAVNYLDLNVEKLGVDMLTLSGSKIVSSGRVGVLYKKNKLVLVPIMHGGDQEQGLRPGTEDVKAILEFTKALTETRKIQVKESKRLTTLRDYFFKKISNSGIRKYARIVINGDLVNRLPNNVNITIPNIPSDLLVIELSARGIMASAKSACKSGDGKASYVIQAINKEAKDTDGSLRFSLGRQTDRADIDYVIKSLQEILNKLSKWYN